MIGAFKKLANDLRCDNLRLLKNVYADDIHFVDPLHEVRGLVGLERYFGRLYEGVADISFDFHSEVERENEAFMSWTMSMRHKRFRPGEVLTLPGATWIRFDDKITFHRDYFDAGAMLYERVPLLGSFVRSIKRRV